MLRLVRGPPGLLLRRSAAPSSNVAPRARGPLLPRRRLLSDRPAPSPLAGDAGNKATHVHHRMTTFLALATPVYLLVPDSYADGVADKVLGSALAASTAGHSWIGMNYVATDYVPKVSKALLGPARIFNAALGALTFAGLMRVAWNDKGGIQGALGALWRPVEKEGGEK
ncbi:hypothetical protein ACHAWF_013958 [Thalassiosira exigua]